MEKLRTEADAVRDAIGRTVVRNLKRMSRMGVFLEHNVQERYPDFPIQRRRATLGRIFAADEPLALPAGREIRYRARAGDGAIRAFPHALNPIVNFLENILAQLTLAGDRTVLLELRQSGNVAASANGLLRQIGAARAFLEMRACAKATGAY